MEPTELTDNEAEAVEPPDRSSGTGTDQQLVEDELLVEEISIDGMCGVY